MRITRQQMFIEIAHVISKRSTCFRLNVGALVTINDRIVSIGYNGSPPKSDHCRGNDCPGKDGCSLTIHAEENALKYLPDALKPPHLQKDLYCTDSPCPSCANLMLDYGVRRLFFQRQYRITEPIAMLIDHEVDVYQVTPAGYVIDCHTRNVVDLA